ncbi:MAG: hypothetical protein J6Y94_08340, partial [Bacteriovoracaceae bacterium]|nr:hypothetical protein [Bacteriovoracaceae bacterium]
PFWLSFKFPLDHLALRETYDQLRQREDSAAADQLYLYRRTVQEGAPGRGHFMGRDLALRAGIDSWYLRLQQNDFWPQENDRYDAQFVVDQIRWRLKGNKARQTKLLREWEANTAEAIKFYQHLLSEKPSAVLAQDVLKTKARLELENFMAHKRQQIIAFWSGQSLVMQAVYAMETILFGEVGNLDPYGLERADVAQVILNRTAFEKYHQVESPLAPHEESVWSRILFKEGEFSFTYFFIPGSVRLFCFDQTKRGKHLRQQNVRIALQTLQNPRWAFKATRYFSRGPMIGHIDMAKLWPEYAALPEAAGKRIKDGALSKKLHQAWQQGRYDYWYTFTDAQGKKMQVIKVGKQPYVRALSPKKQAGEFYTYRNPQLFRYFALKESGLLMP